MSYSYPHMCRDDHVQIGHSDGEHEMCPLCRAIARAEQLRLELEKIAWMDEFLDADGAKAMMNIAREAVNRDAQTMTRVPRPEEGRR